MQVKAVVFDLDGTLIDSEPLWHWVWSHAIAAKGGALSDALFDRFVGMTPNEWSQEIHERYGVGGSAERVRASVESLMVDRFLDHVPKMKGADRVIDELGHRYRLALATTSGRTVVDTVLHVSGWANDFDVVICGDDVSHGKPAPDLYQRALERLTLSGADVVAIEDSAAGLSAARAAGIPTVEIPDPEYPPSADRTRGATSVLPDLRIISVDVIERTAAAVVPR